MATRLQPREPRSHGMRIATEGVRIVKREGSFIGLVAGHSPCTEMERGIAGILAAFGVIGRPVGNGRVDAPLVGPEIRRVRRTSESLQWRRRPRHNLNVLGFSNEPIHDDDIDHICAVARHDGTSGLTCAWGDSAFLLTATPETDYPLAELAMAFTRKDVLLFLTGEEGDLAGNQNLAIFIASAMPADWAAELAAYDTAAFDQFMAARRAWTAYHGSGFEFHTEQGFGYTINV